MFNFFLNSYRKKILNFSGNDDIVIMFDIHQYDSKECFRRFDNGEFTLKHSNGKKEILPIYTKHNNILHCVIKAKKSWGLWVKEWSIGISECLFTKEEIIDEFEKHNITIPKPLLKEFDDNILKYKLIRYNRDYP